MAVDPKMQAAMALHRFGSGPRVGSVASVAADLRGAVLAELDRPGAGRIVNSDRLTAGPAMTFLRLLAGKGHDPQPRFKCTKPGMSDIRSRSDCDRSLNRLHAGLIRRLSSR